MKKLPKLGVVGNPIEHSLSPFIHSRFARYEKMDIEYKPYKVELDNFDSFIKDFFSDTKSLGLNVTLPFKKNAAKLKGIISDEAFFISAVNTIKKDRSKLMLESTDGQGFLNDLLKLGIDLNGKHILVLGAGAAVNSILFKIIKAKPNKISIINRTDRNIELISKKFSKLQNINKYNNSPVDIIINGSSAGLTGEFKPYFDLNLVENSIFYDLNYSLEQTPFCLWASEKSKNVYDGKGMLIEQAALSFKEWFGIKPDTNRIKKDLNDLK